MSPRVTIGELLVAGIFDRKSARLISTDGGSSSLQGTLDGSGFICNRESLDVNSAAVGDGVGSGTRDNDPDWFPLARSVLAAPNFKESAVILP